MFIFQRRCNEGQYYSHYSYSFRHIATIVTVIIYLVSKFLDLLKWGNHFVEISEVKKFSHTVVNVYYMGSGILYNDSSNAEAGTLC